ncbi:MAG: putative toxin-antitoxin system toxin component, PIN family [Lachnospiraceae bacterium]|nr:putative toxin-antitoxin system toxin component, PIN family [Lachnospiraceae bacterium]MDY4838774.1 putative toxin-antitoxin system toxin component, PIN family [Lachnospiraceae bacterium]
MRILIDTNILISAALNSHGTPYKAYLRAVTYPNKGIICDQNIEELWRIFNRKFPAKISMLEKFLAYSLSVIEVVATPETEEVSEKLIRDVKDRPILRAAMNAKADVLLTGDKDFLESEVQNPKIMTAAEFLEL